MARGTNENWNYVNYVTATLNWLMMSDREWPHFTITKWNREKQEVETLTDSCNYIEWELTNLEVEEFEWEWKKTNKIIFTLVDEEWNDIRWRIWYGSTIRKVLQKLSGVVKAWQTIWKVRFSCWRYSMEAEWKTRTGNYVAVYVDWQKWDDPYDYVKDIQPKVREVKDPETWEVVKRVTTDLDNWILNELVPMIKDWLKSEKELDKKVLEDKELDLEWDNLPF